MTSAPLWHSLSDVPADLGATAVTIGNFDGVHRGHRAVLAQLADIARSRSLLPVVLTFWPHPRHVMGEAGEPQLLTGRAQRDALLRAGGVGGVLDLEFTREFAWHSPEEFVRIFLVEGLGMRCVVMGADSRFGRGNAGDLETMRALGRTYGFEVIVVEDVGPEDGGARISSSGVRDALLSGDVTGAHRSLGRHHAVCDVVHHGHKRGRALGFPTANLGPDPQGLVPTDGVYTGRFSILEHAPEHAGGPRLEGVPATISIGTNPTFPAVDGRTPRIVEAYVHDDRDLDLYGDLVCLEFVQRQRPTVTFETVEALVQQMERDKDVTRRTLGTAGRDGGSCS